MDQDQLSIEATCVSKDEWRELISPLFKRMHQRGVRDVTLTRDGTNCRMLMSLDGSPPPMRIVVFDCRHELLANKKLWVHCLIGDAVRGSLSLEVIAGGEWIWINDLFVDESCRRTGIARSLIIKAVATAMAIKGSLGVNAGVFKENAASSALFESLGFRHTYGFEETRVYSLRFDAMAGDDDFEDDELCSEYSGESPLEYLEETAGS